MNDTTNGLEGLRLISDWSKWLITIETGAIAFVGAAFKTEGTGRRHLAKVAATITVVSFVISIAAAALLLLTLPEIAQTLRADGNIWLTQDSVIGGVFGINTQGLAIVQAFFFGMGVVSLAILILMTIWRSPGKQ